jgi:hypothetical protein
MTQYCHSVESPQTGGSFIPKNNANSFVTDPSPDDSFATSQSTFGRSWRVSTTCRMYASSISWTRASSGRT